MNKIYLLILILGYSFSSEYSVIISSDSEYLYSINNGTFYVELYVNKFPINENVIIRINNLNQGEVCWEGGQNLNNLNIEPTEIRIECFPIQYSFIEMDCANCYSKNGSNTQLIQSVLVPKSINEILY